MQLPLETLSLTSVQTNTLPVAQTTVVQQSLPSLTIHTTSTTSPTTAFPSISKPKPATTKTNYNNKPT